MSDVERLYHQSWLGMVQPSEGLVVSTPVLISAQCMRRLPPQAQADFVGQCPPAKPRRKGSDTRAQEYTIRDLPAFLSAVLGLTGDLYDAGGTLPEELALYVPEGRQLLKPTFALKDLDFDATKLEEMPTDTSTPASRAGARYLALVWDTEAVAGKAGRGLDLDKNETLTGPWEYPPAAKFDRLLRACRVPIGILTNRREVRLVYAPHGEASGDLRFRLDQMAEVGGRSLLEAFVMLLSATRFYGVAKEYALPALLRDSRKRQAEVTTDLAEQVLDALQILLKGFEAAAERDGGVLLQDALDREGDHLYKGLQTVMLRLVFLLYAEERGLMPMDQPAYSAHLSVLALYDRLQTDFGSYPDSMSRRFGAWGQLVALFRAVFLGIDHGDLTMPPRRGTLFDPHSYAFLEGWGPSGSAPILLAEDRADVKLPTVDDETVYRVLNKLVFFEGQRLSYRTLSVEQIGSVYEGLMGFHVQRTTSASVCLRPGGVWVSADEVVALPPSARSKFFKEGVGLAKAQAEKLAQSLKGSKEEGHVLECLEAYRVGGRERDPALSTARRAQLVLQPGPERRRTSSHYTPSTLTGPIVRRTLEPLLRAMGETPTADGILALKLCDPAMGSGAFLVQCCRFLADQLVAAWTREGRLDQVAKAAPNEDPVLHARRLVAQRCLYGVDKNAGAVELAKLSLWLETLAKDLPFTFLDHALRHGDSLVGLNFEQIRSFHWKEGQQLELCTSIVKEALDEAVALRQEICALAHDTSREGQRRKEVLTRDASDASDRARLVADTVIGAFFAAGKEKPREEERIRRLDLVQFWLAGDDGAYQELRRLQEELRAQVPAFHWMLEFPEVFYAERPDPLDECRVNGVAHMDALLGNPPFSGKNGITAAGGEQYLPWLLATHQEAHGNADLCAHFLRRSAKLLGAHGTIGLIATNTIAQGDTRATGLQYLVTNKNFRIYDATRTLQWPGLAAVTVSVVHLARGTAAMAANDVTLDKQRATAVNSRLRGAPERDDPRVLAANNGCAYQGSIVLGMGFTFDDTNPSATSLAEMERLLKKSPKNRQVVFPYLGGEEVNTHPEQAPHRYVINFDQRSVEEAEQWPDLLAIVREKVKPERAKSKRDNYRKNWWLFGEYRPGLFASLAGLQRCLVTARTSKHVAFSFQPAGRVFSENLVVFPLSTGSCFAVLQSRVHLAWVALTSSTLEDRQGYRPSDCFGTFPFPNADPRSTIPEVEALGERLHEARAKYMVETAQGLTVAYNRLKDPSCDEHPVVELRRLHEAMDEAVLRAYGWDDLRVPAFCPASNADRRALAAFEDAVIDRLFVLNAERAAQEELTGPSITKVAAAASDDAAIPALKASLQKGRATSRAVASRRGTTSEVESSTRHRRPAVAERKHSPKTLVGRGPSVARARAPRAATAKSAKTSARRAK